MLSAFSFECLPRGPLTLFFSFFLFGRRGQLCRTQQETARFEDGWTMHRWKLFFLFSSRTLFLIFVEDRNGARLF